MAILLVIIGAILAAVVNLMTKKNLDEVSSPQGYLVLYFFFSIITCFFVSPQLISCRFDLSMFSLGLVCGGIVFFSMNLLPKALKYGPSGLTFAFQNASSLLPTIFLFYIFGENFGYILTPQLLIGLALVLFGLFWSAYPDLFQKIKSLFVHKKEKAIETSKGVSQYQIGKWLFFALLVFILQGLVLSFYHWKSLMLIFTPEQHPLFVIDADSESEVWFLPGVFTSATLLNAILFLVSEKRFFKKSELKYGTIGGVLNGVVTFLVLLITQIATPAQKAIAFPLFAVLVIMFCSLWGKWLYKERINWPALIICLVGVLFGTIGG